MPVEAHDGHRRHYYDRDRAEALAALEAHGGNVRATARDTGIPESTLALWRGKNGDMAVGDTSAEERAAPADLRAAAKRDMAQVLERTSWRYLDRLAEVDLTAERPYYLGQTYKILREQHALLTGGATGRVELSLASFLGAAPPALGAAEVVPIGLAPHSEAIEEPK